MHATHKVRSEKNDFSRLSLAENSNLHHCGPTTYSGCTVQRKQTREMSLTNEFSVFRLARVLQFEINFESEKRKWQNAEGVVARKQERKHNCQSGDNGRGIGQSLFTL
uniref:(northern house mosquito) hypothetical protein n=1 Tax=Culex pipiens TaxID=7175 RepID=A0A8D8F7D9_CULPI